MPRRLGLVGTLFRTSWRLCCPMAEKCWTYISTHVQVYHRLFMWGILLDHSWWFNVCPLNCQILRWAVLVENTALGETKERIPAFSIPETFRRVPGQDRKWHGGCQPANVVNPCPSIYQTSGGINYTHWRLPLRLVNDSYTACTVIPTANGT